MMLVLLYDDGEIYTWGWGVMVLNATFNDILVIYDIECHTVLQGN